MTKGVRLLAAACVVLAAAALVVALSGAPSAAETGRADEFQRLVGGLGLGPAVDLSRCGALFDVRVQPACSLEHEPLPGGSAFCPAHARVQ